MFSKTEQEMIMKIIKEATENSTLASMHLQHAFANSDHEWQHINLAAMHRRLADHFEKSNPKLANIYRDLASAHEQSSEIK